MVSFDENLSDRFLILYQSRYCDQEDFSIAVIGSENDRKNEMLYKSFLLNNFDTKIYLPSLVKTKSGCRAIASGSDIYVTDKYKVSVSYITPSTNSWKT